MPPLASTTTDRPHRLHQLLSAVGVVFAAAVAATVSACAVWPAPDRPLPPAGFVPTAATAMHGDCMNASIQQVGEGFWIDAEDCGPLTTLRVRDVLSEAVTTPSCELPCYVDALPSGPFGPGAVYAIAVCAVSDDPTSDSTLRCSADTYVTLDDLPPAHP